MPAEAYLLALLILAAAMLYSSVGHAGASGYLAAMALFGLAPEVMKPTALVLNIFVASIGTYRFARVGCFDWRLWWPFAALAVPLAFVGGAVTLPGHIYKQIVGAVLLVAAANLLLRRQSTPANASNNPVETSGSPARLADAQRVQPRRPPIWLSLICGGALGMLAGLTGTGGGIFLSPLLILTGWADPRRTAGVSAAFILANSVAGLAGQLVGVQGGSPLAGLRALPHEIVVWAPAAVAGGLIGSYFGARRLGNPTIRRLLAIVLVIAGVKMIFT